MNKLFKSKTMRRILLMMALIFPVVYLCGGLFFTLNGAHGAKYFENEIGVVGFKEHYLVQSFNSDVAQERSIYYDAVNEYTIRFVRSSSSDSADFLFDGSSSFGHVVYWKMDFDRPLTTNSTYFVYWSVDNGNSFRGITLADKYYYGTFLGDSDVNIRVYPSQNVGVNVSFNFYDLTLMYGAGNEPSKADFDAYWGDTFFDYDGGSVVKLPVYGELSYSDYLFSFPFVSNNFVSAVGRDVMNGSADGFAPMNDLFRTVNDNVFHFDESDALAVFGFGYLYYAVNVILIYEVVCIALKLVLLPLKAVDSLGGKVDD